MRDENEEQLYWRGVYFPSTLNEQELEEWRRVVHKLDSPVKDTLESHWVFTVSLIVLILVVVAVSL